MLLVSDADLQASVFSLGFLIGFSDSRRRARVSCERRVVTPELEDVLWSGSFWVS